MNRKTWSNLCVVTISLGSLLFIGCSSRHAEMWHSQEGNSEKIVSHIVKELELDGQQKTQLGKVVGSVTSEKRMNGREAFIGEVIAQLRKEKVDEAHLNDIISNNINRVNQDLRSFVINLSDFHGNLTSDQQTKLVALMENRSKRGARHNDHHK